MRRRDFVTLMGAPLVWRPRQAPVADWIFHNGSILTLGRGPAATAIAIGDGKVLGVGSDEMVKTFLGAGTETIDLKGGTVIPGINDSHLHALEWGANSLKVNASYPTVKSIAEIVAAVHAATATKPAGEWIIGQGWDQNYFAEKRAGTKTDLDQVAPNHPVMLTEFSGHAVWVNSKALALAGITRDTPTPDAGVIVKDGQGEPTGVLFESAAGLIYRILPRPSEEERDRALAAALDWMKANGITSFTDPAAEQDEVAAYARRLEAGTLTARTTVLRRTGPTEAAVREALALPALDTDYDEKLLRIAGVKLFADGIPTINKTAWVRAPYRTGGRGSLATAGSTDEERIRELKAMIRAAHQAQVQIGTHATGDWAIDVTVEAYLEAMAADRRPDPRHYVIHADLTMPPTLAKMARHRIGANFNSGIKYLISDGQKESIGPRRAAYEWPFRTAIAAGVNVANGSDAPVTDGDWRRALANCVDRKGKQTGQVSGPEQRITLAQALWTFTGAGAWQDRADAWKGTLTVGRAADLCVLDGPLVALRPDQYPQLKVTLTMVGGRVTHSAERKSP